MRYLLRCLDIHDVEEALAVVTRYFDERQLQPGDRLAIECLLAA